MSWPVSPITPSAVRRQTPTTWATDARRAAMRSRRSSFSATGTAMSPVTADTRRRRSSFSAAAAAAASAAAAVRSALEAPEWTGQLEVDTVRVNDNGVDALEEAPEDYRSHQDFGGGGGGGSGGSGGGDFRREPLPTGWPRPYITRVFESAPGIVPTVDGGVASRSGCSSVSSLRERGREAAVLRSSAAGEGAGLSTSAGRENGYDYGGGGGEHTAAHSRRSSFGNNGLPSPTPAPPLVGGERQKYPASGGQGCRGAYAAAAAGGGGGGGVEEKKEHEREGLSLVSERVRSISLGSRSRSRSRSRGIVFDDEDDPLWPCSPSEGNLAEKWVEDVMSTFYGESALGSARREAPESTASSSRVPTWFGVRATTEDEESEMLIPAGVAGRRAFFDESARGEGAPESVARSSTVPTWDEEKGETVIPSGMEGGPAVVMAPPPRLMRYRMTPSGDMVASDAGRAPVPRRRRRMHPRKRVEREEEEGAGEEEEEKKKENHQFFPRQAIAATAVSLSYARSDYDDDDDDDDDPGSFRKALALNLDEMEEEEGEEVGHLRGQEGRENHRCCAPALTDTGERHARAKSGSGTFGRHASVGSKPSKKRHSFTSVASEANEMIKGGSEFVGKRMGVLKLELRLHMNRPSLQRRRSRIEDHLADLAAESAPSPEPITSPSTFGGEGHVHHTPLRYDGNSSKNLGQGVKGPSPTTSRDGGGERKAPPGFRRRRPGIQRRGSYDVMRLT